MKYPRLYPEFLLAAALAAVFLTAASAEENATAIKFSDPANPGTLKIMLSRGNLRVQGTDATEVTVKTQAKAATKTPRKDGLREIASSGSFSLGEKDNVITLDAASDGWMGGNSDFVITVPRNSSLVVQNSWGGGSDITCVDLTGDVDLHSANGEIRLENVKGGVVAEAYNGEIRASVAELHENKPLSFTSMNGEVLLRLPTDAKANVRFRTQNGAVLTDFSETALVTKTESAPRMPRKSQTISINGKGVLPVEAQQALHEAARVSVQAVNEAAQAIRDGVEAAHEKAEAQHERTETERDAIAPRAPRPPRPPAMPRLPSIAVPTITGGKLVTGTLNGGGPEVSVSTMNGDITLRQLK